jgi:hypothetical protein
MFGKTMAPSTRREIDSMYFQVTEYRMLEAKSKLDAYLNHKRMNRDPDEFDGPYAHMIEHLRLRAEQLISDRSTDEQAKLLSKLPLRHRLLQLNWICQLVKFFPDPAAVSFLQEKMRLANSITRWFIPIQEIERELKTLEAAGITVSWVETFITIDRHLNIKLLHEFALLVRTVYDDGVKLSLLSKSIRQLTEKEKRALNEDAPLILRNDFEKAIYFGLILLARRISPEYERSLTSKLVNGKTEYDILDKLEKECLQKPEAMSQRSFYIHLYGLLQLICKDTKNAWPADDDEWSEIRDIAGDWDQYRSRKVEAYLRKK